MQILKIENFWVDLLSRLATAECPKIHREAYVENLKKPSIEDELAPVMHVDREP